MGQKGSFLIRPFDGKIILKLKGDFNRQNAQWVKKVMTANPCLQKRILELDMQEVDIIDIQAMALISTTLKSLKDRGIATAITGLDSDKRTLAYSLGMHHITQINQE